MTGLPVAGRSAELKGGDVQKLTSRAQVALRLPLREQPIERSTAKEAWEMKIFALVPVVLAAAVLLVSATALAAPGNVGFGFNARDISGFPTGSATLTGGGAYNPVSGFVHSAGGFRCTSDIGQGPLRGCLAGEGVRWDTVDLRRSTTFKCTGAAGESLKTATTDENTVGLDADFYRAGDGNDESFTAQMIVSADDLAPDILGIQNVWIQGVGCASAIANFSS
jgi:hypothetical protein